MWHDHVMAEYRSNAGERDPTKLKEFAKLAEDYTNLVRDVHHERVGHLIFIMAGIPWLCSRAICAPALQ